MPTFATWLVLAGALGAGGLAVEAAERLAPRQRSAVERLALALLAGFAALSVVATALVAAFGPLPDAGVRVGLAALALGGAFAAWRGRARRRAATATEQAVPMEPWSVAQRVVLAVTLAFGAFALVYAATMPMHVFDPVYHFAYKGKLVHHEGFGTDSWTDVDGPVGRIVTHPDYPPGIPTLHALVAGAGGRFDEDATRPLMGWFAVGAGLLLWAALRRAGRWPALLGALGWLGLPLLYYSQLPRQPFDWVNDETQYVETFTVSLREFALAAFALLIGAENAHRDYSHLGAFRMPDGWTLDGAADLPLAALLFGAVWCLVRGLPARRGERAHAGDLALAGLLLAGAGLAKNEGLALAGLALALCGALAFVRTGWRGASAIAVPAALFAVLMAPWLVLRGDIPSIDENYPAQIARVFSGGEGASAPGPIDRSPATVGQAAARVPIVALGFARTFLDVLRWNLLWLVFAAAVAWRLARPRELFASRVAAPLALVLAATALYAVILVVTPWDLPTLFTTAIPDRLMLHVTPLALWIAFESLWRPADAGGERA